MSGYFGQLCSAKTDIDGKLGFINNFSIYLFFYLIEVVQEVVHVIENVDIVDRDHDQVHVVNNSLCFYAIF